MSKCKDCGKELVPLDESLTKKLINRGATEFYCKACLSKRFSIPEQKLDEMIKAFKAQVCSLFT